MNTIEDNTPWSVLVKNNLSGAAGMTFQKSLGEKFDDAFDAGGNPRLKVVVDDNADYLLLWNMGANLPDPARLLGLSKVLSKKAQDKIGLKNRGTLASLCHWQPDRIVVLTKDADNTTHIELTFKFKDYIKMLEQCHANYRDDRLLPSNFMKASDLTLKTSEYFSNMFKHITSPVLKAEVSAMLPGSSAPQFLMLALEFGKSHDLYGNLDTQVLDAISSFKLYHSKILGQPNKEILFELSVPYAAVPSTHPSYNKRKDMRIMDGKQLIPLNASNRVDIMMGNAYICAQVDVGHVLINTTNVAATMNAKNNGFPTIAVAAQQPVDKEIVLRVALSISNKPEISWPVFYITNKPSDRRLHGAQLIQNYADKWSKATPQGSFVMRLGYLSPEQEKAQMEMVGPSVCDSVDELRGVFISWNGRYLGLPCWRRESKGSSGAGNWPAKKNAGAVRADIVVADNHYIIEQLFKVQSDKSVVNLDEADPTVLKLVDSVVGHLEKHLLQSTKRQTDRRYENPNYSPEWTQDELYIIQNGAPPQTASPNPRPPTPPPSPPNPEQLTAPQFMQPSNITTSSFTVSWSGGNNASAYVYSINGRQREALNVSKTATFNNMDPNTEYTIVITAVRGLESKVSIPLKVRTLPQGQKPNTAGLVFSVSNTKKGSFVNVHKGSTLLAALKTFKKPEGLRDELEGMCASLGQDVFERTKLPDLTLTWGSD